MTLPSHVLQRRIQTSTNCLVPRRTRLFVLHECVYTCVYRWITRRRAAKGYEYFQVLNVCFTVAVCPMITVPTNCSIFLRYPISTCFHETHVNGSIRVFTLIEVTMKLERVSSSHSAECLRDDREIWIPSGFGVSACNLCPSTLLWNVRFIAFGNLEICLRSEKTSKLIKISSYVVERTFWTEIFFFWLRFERVEILRGGKQLILLGCTASEILLTNFSRNKFSFFRKNLLSV